MKKETLVAESRLLAQSTECGADNAEVVSSTLTRTNFSFN